MSYTRKNPYISLDELREELKMKSEDIPAGSTTEEDLLRAIDHASRWVDDYTRRDYFFHDHTVTPMEFDQFDDGVYDRVIFPRYIPIIGVTKIVQDDEELVVTDDYVVKANKPDEQLIYSMFGNWFPGQQASRVSTGAVGRSVVQVFGTFGYLQNSSYPVTIAGDTGGQLSAFSLSGNVGAGPYYWELTEPDPTVKMLRLFSDVAKTLLVAEGKTAAAGTAINLWPMNGSGISGTGNIAFTLADTNAGNTFTPGTGVYDSSTVPLNLPGRITLATRLVAAAISGRNRKEIVDLAGQKTTIAESEIPKTVFQILGRRAPILI